MKSAIRHRTLVTLSSAVGVLALTLVATPSALAQSSGVVLTGSIADAAGEAMEGVVVSVRAEGSNLTTSVYTDADGVYVFPHMTPGPYRLRAQAVSYAAGHAEPRLSGAVQRHDLVMQSIENFEAQLPGEVGSGAARGHPRGPTDEDGLPVDVRRVP